MKRWSLFLVASGLVALGAAACTPPSRGRAVSDSARVERGPEATPALLAKLAVFATDTMPSPQTLSAKAALVKNDPQWLDRYAKELVDDARFAEKVAPEILFLGAATPTRRTLLGMSTLTAVGSRADGVRIFSIADRGGCDERAAVKVTPWWDPAHELLVCPDAYQPSHLVDEHGWVCGGTNTLPKNSKFCGCGPYLVNCFRDEEQRRRVVQSLRDEIVHTVGRVVREEAPLERAVTMNETVRDRNAEFMYFRWRALAGEASAEDLAKLSAFPETPTFAPRRETTPGQHAGILTVMNLVFREDAPRVRLKSYFDALWCTTTASVNVGTEEVLALGAADLREGEGWEKLAAMPICTNCHARLDYGMQFFRGYPSVFRGTSYVPRAAASGSGPLYGHDIRDPRGEASLTPKAFAELVSKQHEFEACMAQRVSERVFQLYGASTADIGELSGVFARRHDVKELMAAALVLFAKRTATVQEEVVTSPAAAEAPATATDGSLSLSPWLKQRVEQRCVACHDSGAHGFLALLDRRPSLPRSVMHRMLGQVASGEMPRDTAMGSEERRAMIRAFVGALWPDPGQRQVALEHFLSHTRPLGVYAAGTAHNVIASRAGVAPDAFPNILTTRVTPPPSYSSDFALGVLGEALEACKTKHLVGEALVQCIEEASAPDLMSGEWFGGAKPK